MPAFSPDGNEMVYFKLVGNSFDLMETAIKDGAPVGQPIDVMSAPGIGASSPIVWVK